jgi:DNA invertase Pin-like site-specific DNA recombinase
MKTKSRSAGSQGIRPRRSGAGHGGLPTLGYASVSGSLALDGPEVEVQRSTIETTCRDLGLDLLDLVRDHEPGVGGHDQRPGLAYALERMEAGEASCLIVSDLERLTHGVNELASLVDRLETDGVRLIAVDVGLDTSTPSGRLAVSRRPGVAPPPVATAPAASAAPPVAEPPAPEPVTLEPPVVEPPAALPVLEPLPAEAPAPERSARPPGPGQPLRPREAVRALGYASVPADAESGEDLDAQRRAIERSAERLGFQLVEVVREREPKDGKALERGGLSYLIQRLAAGDASCIVVSGLDRLSRSVSELGTLVQWLEKNEIRLVAVELGLDTSSPGGQTAARALASVGGWERERLSERTRKGLAAARSARRASGSSPSDWAALQKRIATMRADGMTLQGIADVLNEEGVPTPRGGAKWRPSSVQTAAGYKRRSKTKSLGDLPTIDKNEASSDDPDNPRPRRP